MLTIWKKISDESWELVEECSEVLLVSRLEQLREDGFEYRAEKRDGGFASVLEV